MKHKLLGTAAAAAVSAMIFSGCVQAPAGNAGEQSVTASQTAESISETSAETTGEIPNETEASSENNNEPEYVEVSAGNEFIDFEFIENYRGTTEIGELADKAVDFLKTTEYYSDSMENIERINTDELKKDWDAVAGEFYQRDVSMYFNNDGGIQPVFSTAYPADYDGDGKTETFIVVDMPFIPTVTPDIWSFLLFADSSGNIYPDVLDLYNPYSAELLNYGKYKQLGFGGAYTNHTYSSIYGVKDGKPVTLYDHAPGGYFCKTDCFLSAFGLQGGSDFMYFDTVALEYRIIKGVEISHAEMAELDVSNTLCTNFGEESIDELPDYVEFHFIKPNYYLLDWGFPGSVVFTYESGVFTLVEDSNITRSTNTNNLNVVVEFDIDKAVAEMKPPVEPYAKVSEDNVFIDYRFIEDYQGSTDIGVLAAGAVEFLTESEYYTESTENIGEFTDEKFKKYFDESGNILPRLRTAYPEDYDGDGSTETFIIVDMPYMIGTPTERSFLIFADSRGEMTLLNGVSAIYPTTLLDYGDFKQITFGGKGVVGMDDHTLLYSVTDGEAKELFNIRGNYYKSNCFLSAFSWQSSGAFMYYDTVACEYRAVDGEQFPIEKIKEMDSTSALSEFYEWYDEQGFLFAELVGGRYYVFTEGVMDSGIVYLYENGEFIQTEECLHVRNNHFSGMPKVVDIDITKAIAEMKPVAN